jgi:hypothetical protein
MTEIYLLTNMRPWLEVRQIVAIVTGCFDLA